RITTPRATSTTPPRVDGGLGSNGAVSVTGQGGCCSSRPKRSTAMPKIISDRAVRVHTARVRSVFMYERCSDSSTSSRATFTCRSCAFSDISRSSGKRVAGQGGTAGGSLHKHHQRREHEHAEHRHHHRKGKGQPGAEGSIVAMGPLPGAPVCLVPDGRRRHQQGAERDQRDATNAGHGVGSERRARV